LLFRLSEENENLNESILKHKLREDELSQINEQEDSLLDVEIVKIKEVSHLAQIIKFCFQVYEDRAFRYLFGSSKNLSIESAEKDFKENLKLGVFDAFLLARFVIEPREQPTVVLQKDRSANKREILNRLKSISYKKISEKDFHSLETEIRSAANNKYRQKFYDEMQDLSFLDIISRDDITKIINEVGKVKWLMCIGIRIDNHILFVLLCRESKDMQVYINLII
jgi:hypothetical protein